jgi:hypothetical protein
MATEREKKIFSNTRIVRKSQEEYNGGQVWRVELDKSIFGGAYDAIITRVAPEVANRLEPGKQYNLILERQNKRKPDYDGARDWMFYWGMVGIADDDTAPRTEATTNGTAPRERTPSPSGWDPSPSDQWRADGQEKGNSVTNGTVMVMGYFAQHGELPTPEWLKEAATLANFASEEIRFGRVVGQVPEDAPQEFPGPSEDEDGAEPTQGDTQYLKDMLDAEEPFS